MAKTFFELNPQRYTQWRRTRRNGHRVRPQAVIHTYEAPYSRSLLAAATYLTTRTTPGSYHSLVGAASPRNVMQLAPWSAETWHSIPSNNWSVGISMVTYASAWKSIPRAARDNLVKGAAFAAADFNAYMIHAYGESVPARLITRAEAMALKAGFVSHATMDPGRRSDPGKDFPWGDFFDEYKYLIGQGEADVNLNDRLSANPASNEPSTVGELIAIGGRYSFFNWEMLREQKAQMEVMSTAIANLAKAISNMETAGEEFDTEKLVGSINAVGDRVVAEVREDTQRLLEQGVLDVNISLNPKEQT